MAVGTQAFVAPNLDQERSDVVKQQARFAADGCLRKIPKARYVLERQRRVPRFFDTRSLCPCARPAALRRPQSFRERCVGLRVIHTFVRQPALTNIGRRLLQSVSEFRSVAPSHTSRLPGLLRSARAACSWQLM